MLVVADEPTLTEVAEAIHKRMQVGNTHAKMKTLRMLETLLAIESFRKNLKLNGTLKTFVDDVTSLISFEDPRAEEMQINAIRGVATKVAQMIAMDIAVEGAGEEGLVDLSLNLSVHTQSTPN